MSEVIDRQRQDEEGEFWVSAEELSESSPNSPERREKPTVETAAPAASLEALQCPFSRRNSPRECPVSCFQPDLLIMSPSLLMIQKVKKLPAKHFYLTDTSDVQRFLDIEIRDTDTLQTFEVLNDLLEMVFALDF